MEGEGPACKCGSCPPSPRTHTQAAPKEPKLGFLVSALLALGQDHSVVGLTYALWNVEQRLGLDPQDACSRTPPVPTPSSDN